MLQMKYQESKWRSRTSEHSLINCNETREGKIARILLLSRKCDIFINVKNVLRITLLLDKICSNENGLVSFFCATKIQPAFMYTHPVLVSKNKFTVI